MTRIKVCCIRSIEEATAAVRFGADAIGLVSRMPSGPGVINEADIRRIAETVPPGVDTFLLTSLTDVAAIVEQHARCLTTTVQLTDRIDSGSLEELRGALNGVRIVHAVHVEDERAVGEAVELATMVDALLLDSGRPEGRVKELGGTGRIHDWAISRAVVEAVACPVYLAGGLRPDNVTEAIERVRPNGVDVCTGVRSNGALDEEKLVRFFEAVRGG